MLGHHYVSDEQKSVARPDRIESFDEAIASANGAEQRAPSVTTEGDKMQVVSSLVAPQRIAHANLEAAKRKRQ